MTDKEKAIITAFTGIAMLTGEKLGIFYEYISKLLGRPVYSHELADKGLWQIIREKSKPDFLRLCETETEAIPISWMYLWRLKNMDKCPVDYMPFSDLLNDWEKENENN